MTEAVARVSPARRPLPLHQATPLAWAAVAAALGVAAIGLWGGVWALVLVGVAVAAALFALVSPEVLLALLVIAGGIKAAPWLSGLPFDLTLAAALGLLAAMVVTAQRRGLGISPLSTPAVLAALFASLVLLSVLWSSRPGAGLDKALRFETFSMLALFAPVVLLRSRLQLIRLAVALVGFGLLISLTRVSTGRVWEPVAAAGGNEIELGIYSALALIVSVAFLVPVGVGGVRLLWLVPAALLALTVLIAGSRGALISAVLALIFVWSRQVMRSRRTRWIAAASAGAAIVALWVGGLGLSQQSESKYEFALFSTNLADVFGSRGYAFERAWSLAVDHPLGLGTGGFGAEVYGFGYPHNILLEVWVEQGLIGVALLVCLIGTVWSRRIWPREVADRPEVVLAGSLIILGFVEALFSFDINGNRILWFALGLAIATRRIAETE